jgi:HSP20 family protein
LDSVARLMQEMQRWAETPGDSRRVGGGSFPPLNLYDGEDDVLVLAELAGVKAGDLDVNITGDTLVIKGVKSAPEAPDQARFQRREREYGEFVRTVNLPDRVDPDRIEAKLTNGMLRIRLPKAEAAKPRKIAVESSKE